MNKELQILTLWNRVLLIGSQCVNKYPYDFKLQSGRTSLNHFSWEWWKNLIKVLSCRFHKCLGPFTCWLSNDVLKRHFLESRPTEYLTVCIFRKMLAMTIFFFVKMFKIWCRFHKFNKKTEKKVFVFKIIAFE